MKIKWVFITGVLLCLCGIRAYSLTLADARTEVRRLVKDTATSTTLQRYSDDLINTFLRQSQIEVVTASYCLLGSTGIALAAGTTYYGVPNDFIAIDSVRFLDTSGRTRDIPETSYRGLSQNNPDWARQTGPPMQYVLYHSTSPLDRKNLIFIPIATRSSTGTITMDYYKQATDLLSDGDYLLDGRYELAPYHYTVVYQTVMKIKMIEGDTTAVSVYAQLYQASLQAMMKSLSQSPNWLPGMSASTPGNSLTGR
jgi:hypothetical protein